VRGLVFLGYPLHPPGKPEQRRDRHLPDIQLPMLFVQGSRDQFGTSDEIGALLPSLPHAELFVIEGGDHSFKVPARVAKPETVFARVFDAVSGFVLRRT
jgi:predicted alpha/beta-hydrolase family hydrolase